MFGQFSNDGTLQALVWKVFLPNAAIQGMLTCEYNLLYGCNRVGFTDTWTDGSLGKVESPNFAFPFNIVMTLPSVPTSPLLPVVACCTLQCANVRISMLFGTL